tara:strand:+ start:1123 stop:1329 length:207 start_codon:yes stop_codon:yes gene_type:complete
MGNMSYCRFENTTIDIDDCLGAIQSSYEECADLSNREVRALQRLLEQAEEIIDLSEEIELIIAKYLQK